MRVRFKPEQIRAWVQTHFPDNKPRKGGEEIRICNPFSPDAHHHFGISITKGLCHDWRGDEWAGFNPSTGKKNKCTFIKFVQTYLNCSLQEAIRSVVGGSVDPRCYLQYERPAKDEKDKGEVVVALPEGTEPILTSSQHKLAAGLLHWLGTRGLDSRKLEKYKIGHCGFDIVWPYYEFDDLVYWQCRSRIQKQFRFPPESIGVTKGQFLYGFDYVEPASYLVITEAIFDSLTIEEQCVASGGASLTPDQVKKIRLIGPKDGIVLAPDNDGAGVESILKNYDMLRAVGYPLYYSIPPSLEYTVDGERRFTKDWNEIGQFVTGWGGVTAVFEKGIKPLDLRARIYLKKLVGQLKNKSITAVFGPNG